MDLDLRKLRYFVAVTTECENDEMWQRGGDASAQ